jgi:hypothetical protein
LIGFWNTLMQGLTALKTKLISLFKRGKNEA